jgi:succinoglycan biosynthesis protein ExoL
MSAKITYFAHDLADPAVKRRVRMLKVGGAAVLPIGFRRGAKPITAIDGVPAIEIGGTADGMLFRRTMSVLAALTKLRDAGPRLRESHVILARNLEMLVLAARARKRYAPDARLVYECLDIHRLLLSPWFDGALLRFLESRLWDEVDLLLTSSPAFVRNYFARRNFAGPIRIVENKLFLLDDEHPCVPPPKRPPGPPWRVGWFGIIRCRKSLHLLSSLARATSGAVEIVIRGRPSSAVFPDFDAAIAHLPNVQYEGPYDNPGDLDKIYGNVHFYWAIDYLDSGKNSVWLLPNRIYEGSFYCAVPIGVACVETAVWLKRNGVGVVFNEPILEPLIDFFHSLNQVSYMQLVSVLASMPRVHLCSDQGECRALVDALTGHSMETGDTAAPHRTNKSQATML